MVDIGQIQVLGSRPNHIQNSTNFHFEPIEQFWVADQTIFKIRQNFHFEPIEHLKCVSVEPVQMSFVVGIFQNFPKFSHFRYLGGEGGRSSDPILKRVVGGPYGTPGGPLIF